MNHLWQTGVPDRIRASDGRFERVTSPSLPAYGVHYTYTGNSNLLQSGKPTANCETKNGAWKYVWDAENRLIGIHTGDLASPQANDKWLQFKYDYMGRRVEKTYQVYSGDWQVQSGYPIRFVYDGWNPVLVLKSDNSTKYKFTWGLDLSGTIHGAGAIGGLLACEEPQQTGGPKRYWYFYDANGNVGQIMDADNLNGDPAARYEYDPYGNVVGPDPDNDGDWQEHATPFALANPIRFSTKWFDPETGLGYWGHRYYSPRLGRWLSRDPIGEKGGLNLYGFVNNSPIVFFDPLGQDMWGSCRCPWGGGIPIVWVWQGGRHACARACTYAHEYQHFADMLIPCLLEKLCWSRAANQAQKMECADAYRKWEVANSKWLECRGWTQRVRCLKAMRISMILTVVNRECCWWLKQEIPNAEREMRYWCGFPEAKKYTPPQWPAWFRETLPSDQGN